MKMIQAYLRPHMAPKVLDELRSRRIHGVSVFAGRGFGRISEGPEPHYLDTETAIGFVEIAKLELVCPDSLVKTIIDVIRPRGRTGHHGDGKVFVLEVAGGRDIRTGGEGEEAVEK